MLFHGKIRTERKKRTGELYTESRPTETDGRMKRPSVSLGLRGIYS